MQDEPKVRAVAGAFLVAGALILFQVSFTRLVSYKLFYHFVFLAISLTLLGLGAAGTYVAVRREPADADRSIHAWLAALAVSVPAAFLLIANPIAITQHPPIRTKLLGGDAIAYLLWCAPLMIWLNFCGGVVLTTLFTRFSPRMGRLYAADLLGAGAGSLACVALMKYGSPPLAFVSAVVAICVALALFQRALAPSDGRRGTGALAAALALAASAAIFLGPEWLRNFQNFRTMGTPPRPRSAGTSRPGPILKYEWNHLIRTDHVPGWYVLDGEAATQIVGWDGSTPDAPSSTPAYVVAPPEPRVAIIGVGGGLQLAEALSARASHVLAIDVNPTILEWVRGVDRALTRNMFLDPRVDLREGEGRHAIRSAGERFDLIVIHAVDTYAAAASGAYALTENFLYTKEAFADYYRALSDRGVISVSRWLFYPPREDLRLFSTALASLRDLGVASPLDHLVVVAPVPDYQLLGDRRVWDYLLVSKAPFSAEALAELRETAAQRQWSLLFAPDAHTGTPFDALAHARSFSEFQQGYPYFVAAVTDSSPYLFQFYNPLHRTAYAGSRDWATVHIYQWSAVTLLVTLALSIALSLALILGPLLHRRWVSGEPIAFGFRHGLYFAGLGVGFMALEVPIIQLLSLYLGHPTYGFTVALVALLVAAGLGSLIVDRLDVDPSAACAAVGALLAVLAFTGFPLVRSTLDLPDAARFAIALGLVAVCGVPMGFPLALGVRRLGRADARSVAWAWAVNSAASVVGACVVMILLVFTNSQVSLATGAACYAMAAIAGRVPAWRRVAASAGSEAVHSAALPAPSTTHRTDPGRPEP